MLNFPNHYKKLEELNWTYTKDFPIPHGIEHTRLPFKRFMEIQKDFEKNYYGVEIVAVGMINISVLLVWRFFKI